MKRVLVVDDNPLNANLAKIFLSRAGYEVAVVEGAGLALDYLCGNQVDAILSDISMPGMSGKELCREVRHRLGENSPRLVAYTAFALDHQRQSILDAGFDALVLKPASRESMVAAIDPAGQS